MSTDASSTITVHCECGKRLKAPASAAGRKAKCPACGKVMLLSAPPPPEPEPEVDQFEISNEPSFDDFSHLDELAAKEQQAAVEAEANDASARCPNCSRVLEPGAALCVNCGYDVRKGKVLTTATKVKKPSKVGGLLGLGKKPDGKAVKDKLAPQGSIWVGILASLGFGLVASIPWIAVAYWTDKDIYILQLIVGFGAGLGMQLGQKGYSTAGGLLAAGSTFIVLIAMRIILVVTLIFPMMAAAEEAEEERANMTAEQREIAERDPRVAQLIAREELGTNDDVEEEDMDENQATKYEEAHKRAEAKVAKMSRDEYLKWLPKVERDEIRSQLIYRQLDPEIRSMGHNPDFGRVEPEKWDIARKNVAKRIDAMTFDQQKAELKKLDDQAVKDLQERLARAKAAGGAADDGEEEGGSKSVLGFVVLMLLVFAIKPLFFAILAMAAAYRTAAGSVSG